MMQYSDMKSVMETDVSGKLESMQRLMGQLFMPDDERAWFKANLQWSKSNKYAELETRIYI